MSKKASAWILIVIMLLSVFNFIVQTEKKDGYHMDEIYSFGLSNSQFHYDIYDADGNTRWSTASDIDRYLSVSEEHRFDYINVFKNQAEDVHPPLFYIIMHTVASFFPNRVSPYFAVAPNILFALATIVLVYLLAARILHSRKAAVLASAIYALSFGCVTMVIFSRMYSELAFFTTAILYVHLILRDKEYKFNIKSAAGYALLLFAGSLTQYYFFIFMAILAAVTVLDMIRKKYFRQMALYLGSTLLVAGIYILVWPHVFTHLFTSKRGQQSLLNAASSPWIENFKSYITLIRLNLGSIFVFVLLAAVILYVIQLIKSRQTPRKALTKHNDILFISVIAFFFVLIIARVAPYQTSRYITPAFPLVSVIFACGFSYLIKAIMCITRTHRGLSAVLASTLVIIVFGSALHENYRHANEENWSLNVRYPVSEELSQVFKQHSDNKCVMIYGRKEQFLWNFQDYKNFSETAFVHEDELDEFFRQNPMDDVDEFILYISFDYETEALAKEVATRLGFKHKLILDLSWRNSAHSYLIYR